MRKLKKLLNEWCWRNAQHFLPVIIALIVAVAVIGVVASVKQEARQCRRAWDIARTSADSVRVLITCRGYELP